MNLSNFYGQRARQSRFVYFHPCQVRVSVTCPFNCTHTILKQAPDFVLPSFCSTCALSEFAWTGTKRTPGTKHISGTTPRIQLSTYRKHQSHSGKRKRRSVVFGSGLGSFDGSSWIAIAWPISKKYRKIELFVLYSHGFYLSWKVLNHRRLYH